MMAVDILPSGIPIDASKHFSDVLLPYLTTLIEEYSFGGNDTRSSFPPSVLASAEKESDNNGNGDEGSRSLLSSALDRATVARGGELMKDHEWLRKLVEPHIRLELPSPFDKFTQPITLSKRVDRKDKQKLSKKRVLLLGSGMVAQPVVDYLVCKGGMEVTIG